MLKLLRAETVKTYFFYYDSFVLVIQLACRRAETLICRQ